MEEGSSQSAPVIKFLDNEDYFMCSEGIFPARIHDGKNTFITQTTRKHLTHFDTAASKPDFTCKMAVVLAVVALCIATGGAALIAMCAIAGVAGAIF